MVFAPRLSAGAPAGSWAAKEDVRTPDVSPATEATAEAEAEGMQTSDGPAAKEGSWVGSEKEWRRCRQGSWCRRAEPSALLAMAAV